MIDDDHLSPRERRLIKEDGDLIMYVGLASITYSLVFTGD